MSGPSKMEKVPSGIKGEKSCKDMAGSRNLVSPTQNGILGFL